MSGFEIVGVVLGILPLVVQGLESYQEGLRTLGVAWRYQNSVADLITTFEIAAARYRNSCEVLLGPLLLASDDYASLIEEPGGRAWEQKHIQEQLEHRLGYACSTYVRLVYRLYNGLLKFATKMGLDPKNDMRPPWLADSKTNIKTREQFFSRANPLWRATKMAFENGNLEKLLDQIEKDLFRFERLIESSSRVAPIRQEARQKLNKTPWHSVQTAARSLSNVISTNWCCQCTGSHTSFLRLNVPSQQAPLQNGKPHTFGLLVPNDSAATTRDGSGWSCLDVESYGIPQQATLSSTARSQTNVSLGKKQMVTFLVSAADDLSNANVLTSTTMTHSQSNRIGSLCDAMKQTANSVPHIGYLEDNFWRHIVAISRPQNLPVQWSNIMSLADVIGRRNKDKTREAPAPILSTREKYRIALLLATSVLELFSTPWLANPSSLRNIYLLPPTGAMFNASNLSGASSCPITKDLYVSDQPNVPLTHVEKRSWIRNETLFTLAILFLELSYLAPLASFKTAADTDQNGCDMLFTEHLIAARLTDEIFSREPSRYSEAVKRCLYCEFDTSSRDLSESNLQEEFWRGVVEPLKELNTFLG